MPELKEVRTSLSVGFPNGELPEAYVRFQGKASRSVPLSAEFPYEDAQFEVVMLHASAVSRAAVKEAHRVLRPNGYLLFTVNEKTQGQDGYTMPDIYAVVREGFNILSAQRPAWWHFGRLGRTISICAQKKAWRTYTGFSRPGGCTLSPFQNR